MNRFTNEYEQLTYWSLLTAVFVYTYWPSFLKWYLLTPLNSAFTIWFVYSDLYLVVQVSFNTCSYAYLLHHMHIRNIKAEHTCYKRGLDIIEFRLYINTKFAS